MESESPCFSEAKQLSVRVSLKEIAKRFASPLTEEHAWAVLYQLTQRFMRRGANFVRQSNLLRSNQDSRAVITLESLLLSENGEIEVKTVRKRPNREGKLTNGPQ